MIKTANTEFLVLIGFFFFSTQVYFVHLPSTELRTFLLYNLTSLSLESDPGQLHLVVAVQC